MTETQWTAILACLVAAEGSNSSYIQTQVEIAREWFDTQDWDD